MPSIYSNITRLRATELAVSRGGVDYQTAQVLNNGELLLESGKSTLPPFNEGFTLNPIDVFGDVASNNVLPGKGYQPRGIVATSINTTTTSFNITTLGQQGVAPNRNNFAGPRYEGTTSVAEYEALTGRDFPIPSPPLEVSDNGTYYPEYSPYVGNWKVPYSSKIIPIFANGGKASNGVVTDNTSYALLELLDFDLPYVKCNILQGEISCLAPGSFNPTGELTASSPSVVNIMKTDVMFQYPLYNAIEIIIATKSGYSDSSNFFKGSCWAKKVFLINWKLKTFTETPFPEIASDTIQRKYWYPAGLLPVNGDGNSQDLAWNRYSNYVYDSTLSNSELSSASTWLLDYGLPSSNFADNKKPLEIIENDQQKKATIKINAIIAQRNVDKFNKFSAKGLAKII